MLTISVIFGRLSYVALVIALGLILTAILSPNYGDWDEAATMAAGFAIVAYIVNIACRAMHSRYWDDELWR